MAKFLLFALIIGVVVLLLKNYQRALTRQNSSRTGAGAGTRGAESMVQCAHCGIHTPKGESFLSQGRYYCTNEHLKLGPKVDTD